MARDVALCRKLPPVPAYLIMILLKQRRSYLVTKIGKKTALGCAKITDRSLHPETRVNLIKRETAKHGHTSRQPAKFSLARGQQCWIEQNQHKNAELYKTTKVQIFALGSSIFLNLQLSQCIKQSLILILTGGLISSHNNKKGFTRPKNRITEVGYMYVSWTQEKEIEEKHPLEQWYMDALSTRH